MANGTPVPTDDLKGGPTSYNYTYDDLYRLTDATGNYKEGAGHTHEYTLAMAYDTIHNITGKTQAHNRITPPPDNSVIPQQKTTYDWTYDYGSSKPHAATHIGDRTFTYDANGNQTGWDNDNNGQRRTIIWDEENRIQSIIDNGKTSTYKYNDQGERAIKRTGQGETVYVNQWYVIRDREVGEKHVFAGTTRISTKLEKPDGPGGGAPLEDAHYFYHPDHLGSSSYITNDLGQVFQHLEYFPFGETFVEEHSNTQRAPYLFTGKELDEDTGLYYYGARYYDPRTSLWQSADPLLSRFSSQTPIIALNLYQYGLLNPCRYTDPDGTSELDRSCFFTCMTTFEAGKRNTSIDQAISRGAVFRTFTGPAIIGAGYGPLHEPIGTAFDIYDSGSTMFDPDTPLSDKVITGVGLAAGAVMPGAGYGPAGKAVVRKHGKTHVSIEVQKGDTSLQTHQTTSERGRSTFIEDANVGTPPGKVTGEKEIFLPDADAAMKRQRDLMDAGDLGPYNVEKNSCLSHVCDILKEGGVEGVPAPKGRDQERFLKSLGQD